MTTQTRTGTRELSSRFSLTHQRIKTAVRRYKEKFEEFAPVVIENSGQYSEYFLTEEQVTYLFLILPNNDKTIEAKTNFIKDFCQTKRALAHLASETL